LSSDSNKPSSLKNGAEKRLKKDREKRVNLYTTWGARRGKSQQFKAANGNVVVTQRTATPWGEKKKRDGISLTFQNRGRQTQTTKLRNGQ